MQYAGFRKVARRRTRFLTAVIVRPEPHTSSTMSVGLAAQLIIRRKLDELRPGDQLGFLAGRLRGKIHGGGKDMGNIHGFGEHPARDDAPACDHNHRGEFSVGIAG